jgi:hypothetical protein
VRRRHGDRLQVAGTQVLADAVERRCVIDDPLDPRRIQDAAATLIGLARARLAYAPRAAPPASTSAVRIMAAP